MRNYLRVLASIFILSVLTGCQPSVSKQYLVVGFESGQELRYRFISERVTDLMISNPKTATREASSDSQEMTEKMDLTISYIPGPADEYGRTTVKAKCLSAKVTRKGFGGKGLPRDAVERLAGKTFKFTVSATGEIEDSSSLDKLVKEIGKSAFAAPRSGRKVKNPDMINDFISMQFHLWDSVGKINNPRKGVKLGQTWQTNQMMPVSMPINMFRQTTYTLSDVVQTDSGSVATIDSTYQKIDKPVEGIPVPYESGYMPKGMFVVLIGYNMTDFEGGGRQEFNIDRGVIENDEQHYKMAFDASFFFPLGQSKPSLKLDQKMSIKLLD